MNNSLKVTFIFLSLLIISCSGNGGKTSRSQLVPVNDVISILTDLYVADGLLSFPPVRIQFSAKDSIISYIEIIEKHGYTKEQMDNTLEYYFIKNPKKLEGIYDEVLAKLSEMQSRLATLTPPIAAATTTPPTSGPVNLWTLAPSFAVPEIGVTNSISFSIPVKDTGMYELSMTTVVFPDDQSINPRISVFFWHADGTTSGVRNYWDEVSLPKDGKRHHYTLSKKLPDTTFTHINGWLLFNDAKNGRWEKHALVDNVTLQKITKK